MARTEACRRPLHPHPSVSTAASSSPCPSRHPAVTVIPPGQLCPLHQQFRPPSTVNLIMTEQSFLFLPQSQHSHHLHPRCDSAFFISVVLMRSPPAKLGPPHTFFTSERRMHEKKPHSGTPRMFLCILVPGRSHKKIRADVCSTLCSRHRAKRIRSSSHKDGWN